MLKKIVNLIIICLIIINISCDGASSDNTDSNGDDTETTSNTDTTGTTDTADTTDTVIADLSLNDLRISNFGEKLVEIEKPTFKGGCPDGTIVKAYIGEEFDIKVDDKTVSNYLEGNIDVSTAGYVFDNLDTEKNYKIIVVASNKEKYSVRQILASIADKNDVSSDYQDIKKVDPESFLSDEDKSTSKVTQSLVLPKTGPNGSIYIWQSSNDEVIGSEGNVIRYLHNSNVKLTLRVQKGSFISEPVNFNFTVYRILFYENFDNNFSKWYKRYKFNCKYSFSISNEESISGNSAKIRLADDGYAFLYHPFSSPIRPEYIGYYIYTTGINNVFGNSLILSKVTSFSNEDLVKISFQDFTNIRYYDTIVGEYAANKWHHVELKNINWKEYNFDLYINEELIGKVDFKNKFNYLNRLELGVADYTTVYYDEILVW